MNANTVIGEISRNSLEKLVFTVSEYRGKQRIDIRVHFRPEKSNPDKWVPTRKGVNVDIDTWPKFKALIAQTDQILKKSA